MVPRPHCKKILISAGPTCEDIDPIRFFSNRSTGKMGFALARAAKKQGHDVILVTGPTSLAPPKSCQVRTVRSAREMKKAMLKYFSKADIIIKTAAVADYRPQKTFTKKLKKQEGPLTLTFVRNPDILKALGKIKKAHQTLVGFAAETHQGLYHAKKKLKEKKLDWIILNDVSRHDIGFGSDSNEVLLMSKGGEKIRLKKQSKLKLAQKILAILLA